MVICRWILLGMRNISDKFAEKIKTPILCSVNIVQNSLRFWGNVEEYGRVRQAKDDNIIRRMRFACQINNARIKAHKFIFNTYCFSTSAMVTRTGLSVISYVHCVSCSCLYWDLQNLWMWSVVTEMPRLRQVLTAAGSTVRCILLC